MPRGSWISLQTGPKINITWRGLLCATFVNINIIGISLTRRRLGRSSDDTVTNVESQKDQNDRRHRGQDPRDADRCKVYSTYKANGGLDIHTAIIYGSGYTYTRMGAIINSIGSIRTNSVRWKTDHKLSPSYTADAISPRSPLGTAT